MPLSRAQPSAAVSEPQRAIRWERFFGIATAAGEGIGAVEDNKRAKIDAANAEAKKQADAEAAAKRQEEIRQNNASYSQGKQWDNSYNAGMSQKQPTVQKPAVSSGNNKNNTASGS